MIIRFWAAAACVFLLRKLGGYFITKYDSNSLIKIVNLFLKN